MKTWFRIWYGRTQQSHSIYLSTHTDACPLSHLLIYSCLFIPLFIYLSTHLSTILTTYFSTMSFHGLYQNLYRSKLTPCPYNLLNALSCATSPLSNKREAATTNNHQLNLAKVHLELFRRGCWNSTLYNGCRVCYASRCNEYFSGRCFWRLWAKVMAQVTDFVGDYLMCSVDSKRREVSFALFRLRFETWCAREKISIPEGW